MKPLFNGADTDFTDLPDKIWPASHGGQAGYTALYFRNAALAAKAAAFMKWRPCLNNDTIVQTI